MLYLLFSNQTILPLILLLSAFLSSLFYQPRWSKGLIQRVEDFCIICHGNFHTEDTKIIQVWYMLFFTQTTS
jgi:hypothetical protein